MPLWGATADLTERTSSTVAKRHLLQGEWPQYTLDTPVQPVVVEVIEVLDTQLLIHTRPGVKVTARSQVS